MTETSPKRLTFSDLGREPFRLFFPVGVLAGLLGVLLWPLYFWGGVGMYPGQAHARIMAFGFFGGFIFGFLGTALPRMLSARALGLGNVLVLLLLHLAMVVAFALGRMAWGDGLFAALLLFLLGLMLVRALKREDIPPPGFVLVGMALLCVLAAAILGVWQDIHPEMDSRWIFLQRLLAYQGFVLLPILGVGPFILPRFFGRQSTHLFPETLNPTPDWTKKALLAGATGVVIVGSFFIEIFGRHDLAYGLRFLATVVYLAIEFPFRPAQAGNALTTSLRIALALLVAGFLAVLFWPGYRTGLLHLTLVGGFAVVVFAVATRVVFGHSGNLRLLEQRNRWLLVAVILMLLAMATRISGDFWPHIMVSHYNYGAILWAGGVLLWSFKVLPKVFLPDPED
jgi:uncharacterized protein involved in response to NO